MDDLKNDIFLINKEVNKTLENILNKKVFSNGYIFYGSEGVGKKDMAIEFAYKIFKQNSSKLNIKEQIIENNHPDFLLIEPSHVIKGNLITRSEDKNTKDYKETIRIDQIRKIKTFFGQKSIESGKKIVVIIDAHLLNEAASNCLLKTLEEPTNGIFILITPRLNLLLETIISRCQIIRFKNFSYEQLDKLIQNNLDQRTLKSLQETGYKDLIKSANGSPRDLFNNLKTWNELPLEIRNYLKSPLVDNLVILEISRIVSEKLDLNQQILLINFLQYSWWKETKNEDIITNLENLKSYLKCFIKPRLAWEVTLLKIAFKDL